MVQPNLKLPIVVIAGQTGSGKGALARRLAVELGGEIVVADSRKIYRGFDIGTAKPPRAWRTKIAYHVIDCCSPWEKFSAADYRRLADSAISDIHSRGKVAIVAGGTGLYIRTLLRGIIDTPPRSPELRAELELEEKRRPGWLHRKLESVDPEAASRLPASDTMRLVRALEVYLLTGKPISWHQRNHRFGKERYRALMVAPYWPREELYDRINRRVDAMMEQGWLEEVRELLGRGLGPSPAFYTVGYRQLKEHLEGGLELERVVEDIKREHRRYARRQRIWFQAEPGLEWIPAPVDEEALVAKARDFLRLSGSSSRP
ncbi:MAG: tRNA (adenosine(37)-N6)-dimethylallyltransferase MiaA [Deltaproteobacteria bacterium]|nr:MAG: tRNA (adenosine(37)-N6)-dimethylallyltransferase MiaA [Deltaproteobacteria bacterium]